MAAGRLVGWSKTLFILAHELPQEVGDYGILISSGFDTWQALGFNFLSALVALAGTVVALAVGERPEEMDSTPHTRALWNGAPSCAWSLTTCRPAPGGTMRIPPSHSVWPGTLKQGQ